MRLVWVGAAVLLACAHARTLGPDAPKLIARAFEKIAWPAYGIAFFTGMWNLFEIDGAAPHSTPHLASRSRCSSSPVPALLHSRTPSRPMMAITGAPGGILALVILFLGILLEPTAHSTGGSTATIVRGCPPFLARSPTPVIVGVAQILQRLDDVADAVEAIQLMIDVTRAVGADTGVDVLATLDAIGVINGAWSYGDPGLMVEPPSELRRPTMMLSAMGGNSPQSFVNAIATRIQAGQLNAAPGIVGAETIWSRRRQRAAQSGPGSPDGRGARRAIRSRRRDVQTPFEETRGLKMPINYYPISNRPSGTAVAKRSTTAAGSSGS
ncbi:MAG: hypothetical protein R2706_02580 [Acidimicrobiales bacterium]